MTGFTNIRAATISPRAAYSYRSGMGLIPSAEFMVDFDDFTLTGSSNVPDGWQTAVIDTGATSTIATGAGICATGGLLLSDATASEGIAIHKPKVFQLTIGKRLFMEARVRTDDVTDNALQFGLTALTAATNPEDLWTTVQADLIAFGILDGSAATVMLSDASNSGTTIQTGTRSMVADTWHTLAIAYDGNRLRGFVDGKLSLLWSGVIPTGVALAPFIGVLNGNGAGGNNNYFDYVRVVIER